MLKINEHKSIFFASLIFIANNAHIQMIWCPFSLSHHSYAVCCVLYCSIPMSCTALISYTPLDCELLECVANEYGSTCTHTSASFNNALIILVYSGTGFSNGMRYFHEVCGNSDTLHESIFTTRFNGILEVIR